MEEDKDEEYENEFGGNFGKYAQAYKNSSSDDEQDKGVYGRRTRDTRTAEEQTEGYAWDFDETRTGLGGKRATGGARGPKYATKMSFIKKETITTEVKPESMVKEVPKESKEEEQRKSKFVKPEKTSNKTDMPMLFGRGGSKKEFNEYQEIRQQKKEEGKFKMYGKALKMMKNMGFNATKGIGKEEQGQKDIVHAHKRKDGMGLGLVKEKPRIVQDNYEQDQDMDLEAPSTGEVPKQTAFKQPPKPSDRDFLNFLMKTNKETHKTKVDRNIRDQFEDNFTTNRQPLQKSLKDLNIIDETGGVNNEFLAAVDSRTEMTKGFLYSDQVQSSSEKSKLSKIVSKYTSQKMRLKSMLQSAVNKKSYTSSVLVLTENELKSTREQVDVQEAQLSNLKSFQAKVNNLINAEYGSSLDMVNAFKQFYLEKSQADSEKEETHTVDCADIDLFSFTRFNCATLMLKMLCSKISKEAQELNFESNPLGLFDTIVGYREFLLKILEDNVTKLAKDEDEGLFGFSRQQEKQLESGKQIANSYLKITLDYVIPRIKNELSKITPQSFPDTGIYTWLAPWLNLFDMISESKGIRIAESFQILLRIKLVQLLRDWQPGNVKITNDIIKWKDRFDEVSWKSLMSQYVVPKLSYHLEKLKINPKDQHIEPVNWIIKWSNCLSKNTLADLFIRNLLPKWIEVLQKWLQHTTVDHKEVMDWYFGWKSILPQQIAGHEQIRKYFIAALILIESSLN